MHPSISENKGIALLSDQDLHIYSVGISTGGTAEIRMAEQNPNRTIIASTIDSNGAHFAIRHIEEKGLSKQITVKVEDVSKPLPYKNKTFDFVYARLVLHYLPKVELKHALDELHRVLKEGGKLFVVVRSTKCSEANFEKSIHDPETGLTTYSSDGNNSFSRYFHSETSIQEHLKASGFTIANIETYEEQLCIDFQRTILSTSIDSLIQVLAVC